MMQNRSHRFAGLYAGAIALGLVAFLFIGTSHAASDTLDDLARQVAAASTPSPPWTGPTDGPAGVGPRKIAVVCEDLRNGGVLGVAEGLREAAAVLEWEIRIYDAEGSPDGRRKALASAASEGCDGLVLVGSDAETLSGPLAAFPRNKIPVVGWHVGPQAGALDGPIAVNISTDPLAVARLTAMAVVVRSEGRAGVVIFTDSNFAIAMAKSQAMAEVIRTSPGCTLLEVIDAPISTAAYDVPGLTHDLLERYGMKWDYGLAINDIYFDYASGELTRAGRNTDNLKLLSAGDGSGAAFLRIHAGTFQTGTVAEPLRLQGWQLADELNRLFAHEPVSGYIVPVHLVTEENAIHDGGMEFRYDPDNGYREIYRGIWKR